MNVKFFIVVEAVAEQYKWHYNDASQCVRDIARTMGYPRPGETGIWPRDVYAILRQCARKAA